MKKLLLILIAATALSLSAFAQETSSDVPDSVAFTPEKKPFFDMFRPIYLTSGIPLSEKPTANNADLKFQYSFRINAVQNLWGFEFAAFFGFTQRSTWNLYAYSSPFYDNIYIPGGYFEIPFRSKKTGKITSELLFGYEHRSNGRDDIYSRSVNYAFATYSYFFPFHLTLQATARFGDSWYGDSWCDAGPFVMYTKYLGFVDFSADYVSPKKHFNATLSVSPLLNKSIANVTAEVGGRFGKNKNIPYFFVQYHYGYDEALRDCRTIIPDVMTEDGHIYYNGADPIAPKHMLRFGILLYPSSKSGRCFF